MSNTTTLNVSHQHGLEVRLQQQHQQQKLQQSSQPPAQSTTSLAVAATASPTIFSALELAVENVMPGIYLTKNFMAWNEENLRAHNFTHIIIIDKHIIDYYYPSPVFKLVTQSYDKVDAFDASAFEYFCPTSSSASLSFGKEVEAIDLNFGEKSYLTTVLPNCYLAVKFIHKALQAGGNILVIDCNGSEQKCVTITVAYLMYKHNINFSNAFARLKDFYKKADLDKFYMSQLYEYEPILQVQRAQSRGHSCLRELNAANLKRKKVEDDVTCADIDDDTTFFDTLNPLSQFNTAQQQQQQQHNHHQHQTQLHNVRQQQQNTWDDYAME